MEDKEKLNHERRILKRYLSQYRIARLRQKQLKARHKILTEDLANPLQGVKYGGMPCNTNVPSEGAASIVFRIADVEANLLQQHTQLKKICIEVMNVLDFLPDDSDGRMLLELRYIDGMGQEDLADNMHLSIPTCWRMENKALDKLLSYDKVRELVGLTS